MSSETGERGAAEPDWDRPARDRDEVIDLLQRWLLGEDPTLSSSQLAEEVGIGLPAAQQRWRSLGFAAVPPDEPVFTHADLEALQDMQRLIDLGVMPEEDQQALIRSVGRSFARLADWQMAVLGTVVDPETTTLREMAAVMEELTPTVERLQQYVWRRHTLLAASRLLLAGRGDEAEPAAAEEDDAAEHQDATGTLLGVGFADIVGYTRTSRSLGRRELTRFVDHFEGRALEIATAHGGRIIKTIGDEVLFVADTPEDLARLGLALVEERQGTGPEDQEFPELRVGLAWGETVARLGDVLGPVVNIASRLTSTARPGTVLADRSLADRLAERDDLHLRRVRRVNVKGYRKLEPYVVRRGRSGPGDDGTDAPSDA